MRARLDGRDVTSFAFVLIWGGLLNLQFQQDGNKHEIQIVDEEQEDTPLHLYVQSKLKYDVRKTQFWYYNIMC